MSKMYVFPSNLIIISDIQETCKESAGICWSFALQPVNSIYNNIAL